MTIFKVPMEITVCGLFLFCFKESHLNWEIWTKWYLVWPLFRRCASEYFSRHQLYWNVAWFSKAFRYRLHLFLCLYCFLPYLLQLIP